MNTRVKKTQEVDNRKAFNSFTKYPSSGKSVFQFIDNREESLTQSDLKEMANNSKEIRQLKTLQEVANTRLAKPMKVSTPVIQRQVPQGSDSKQKEIPNTVYTARGGENKMFNKDRYPRKNFSFGAHTRNAVFMRYNPQFAGNRIISIRGNSGEQVNVEGVQLDHQISWDTIANAMHDHNINHGRDWKYSLFDAKMYYNDIENLLPALGAINASAGKLGVNEMPRIHHGLEIYQGNLQTAWMNLQAGLVAVGHGITDENAEKIAILLHNVTSSMNDVTEEIL
ncbi:hypothetical protein [Mongoliibacter ruber]|uniref:Uncharacterized protein n=1 Tax=Mongoliibacter ruber TaxID=1750599 RepID=A0A2T0WVI6_9BACT|nr:hypothetical protein [Mongoliibacter ruber]PRY90705.1 hypothetical protein CLW00_101370 [Mongoliibacter ruber]